MLGLLIRVHIQKQWMHAKEHAMENAIWSLGKKELQ